VTTEELSVLCFDCGLAFEVSSESPDIYRIFAEIGCINPECATNYSLFVSNDSTLTGNGDASE